MLSYFMLPTIVKPTRVTESTGTLIDNIFINPSNLVVNFRTGILYWDISDHFPIFYLQKSTKSIEKAKETVVKRNFSMAFESLYKEELSDMANWDTLYNRNDSDYKYFSEILNEKHYKNFPVKKCRVNLSNYRRPWVTSAILKPLKIKKISYINRRSRTQLRKTSVATPYRNLLNHLIRYSKKKYFKNLLEKSKGNLYATWNAVNEILNKRKTRTSNVSFLNHNGKCYKGNNPMASVFNKFFTNVGPSLLLINPLNNSSM